MINTKPIIKKKEKKKRKKEKEKELLSELKKFKFQSTLVLEYKKRNNHKIFHSSAKLIANDSDINVVFKSMHQNVIAKIKKTCL